MAQVYAGISGTNTYVPNSESTGGLIIGFARNESKYPVMEYMQNKEVKNTRGFYATYQSEQQARLSSSDFARFAWARGAAAPTGFDETENIGWDEYYTSRFAIPFGLPEDAVDQADHDTLAFHKKQAAQRMMTLISKMAATALEAADWASVGATDTATNLGGGLMSAGTDANPYIHNTITAALAKIVLNTTGAIDFSDLMFVCNPDVAQALAKAQEIFKYHGNSVYAYPFTERDPKLLNKWGLPPRIAGLKVVVDDTVIYPTKRGGTQAPTWTLPANTAYILARPGGVSSAAGGPAFSTLTRFWYRDEMTHEDMHDVNNRIYVSRVVTDCQVKVVSPKAGYRITGVVS